MSGTELLELLVALVAALLIGFAVWMVLRPSESIIDRVKGYVEHEEQRKVDNSKSLIERALGDQQSNQLAKLPLVVRISEELEVASLQVAPVPLAVLTVVLTVLVGWAVALSTGSAFAAILGLFVPVLAVSSVRVLAGRQRRLFGEQIPDNLQVVASSLRSGQTFAGALRSATADAPEPSRREFTRVVTDESIGVPMQVALERVADRMQNDEMRNLALIAMLTRETGGSSAEVIDLIADTAHEKTEVRRLVRGLTAQGRLSGSILTLMPVGLLVMVSLVNPGYVHPLFHTTTGEIAVVIALVLLLLGGMAIRKIIDVKV